MRNLIVSSQRLEELKQKLIKLYEGDTNCSGKYMLGFHSMFGNMPAEKFRAMTKAYHDILLVIETKNFVNFMQSEEDEKTDGELIKALEKFADIADDKDPETLLGYLADDYEASRLTFESFVKRFPNATAEDFRDCRCAVVYYLDGRGSHEALLNSFNGTLSRMAVE
ncbi:MAG: hypothetical protein LBR70_03760 [Lactobacillaceae bacterium]|jgi:hypothetical protein|nr:hypothetical protein [Lactobacillaceae bacterium]